MVKNPDSVLSSVCDKQARLSVYFYVIWIIETGTLSAWIIYAATQLKFELAASREFNNTIIIASVAVCHPDIRGRQ